MIAHSWKYPVMLVISMTIPLPGKTANLLLNPDFDSNYDNWIITTNGSTARADHYPYGWMPDGTMGYENGGSLGLAVYQNSPSSALAAQCVALDSQTVTASVLIWPFLFPNTMGGPATSQLVAFGTADCSGNPLDTFPLLSSEPITGGARFYELKLESTVLPPQTASVRFELMVVSNNASATTDYDFDHASLNGEVLGIIFANGFE